MVALLVCMPGGREGNRTGQTFLWSFPLLILMDGVVEEGKGDWHIFTLSDGAFGLHVGGPEARPRGTFSYFALPPVSFYEVGREEENGMAARLTCIKSVFGMQASGSRR